MNIQQFLTYTIEAIAIYHLVMLAASFVLYAYNEVANNTTANAPDFYQQVKDLMETEVEAAMPVFSAETTIIKEITHKVVAPSQLEFSTMTVKALRAYIKTDSQRRERVEQLIGKKYYRGLKAELVASLTKVA